MRYEVVTVSLDCSVYVTRECRQTAFLAEIGRQEVWTIPVERATLDRGVALAVLSS